MGAEIEVIPQVGGRVEIWIGLDHFLTLVLDDAMDLSIQLQRAVRDAYDLEGR